MNSAQMCDFNKSEVWHGPLCATPGPLPLVGAVRGAPGHQTQQRDARLVLQHQAGGLWPRPPHRPQPRTVHTTKLAGTKDYMNENSSQLQYISFCHGTPDLRTNKSPQDYHIKEMQPEDVIHQVH
jgi:hypothetical protein